MARDKKPASVSVEPAQEEMTVVVLRFKGGSHTLQKGFDAVNQAIAALGAPQQSNHRIAAQRQSAQLPHLQEHVVDAGREDIPEETGSEETTRRLPCRPATASQRNR